MLFTLCVFIRISLRTHATGLCRPLKVSNYPKRTDMGLNPLVPPAKGEKSREFVATWQESTISQLQAEVAELKKTVASLRLQNNVLRVRNGEVQRSLDHPTPSATDVRRSLSSWGALATSLDDASPALLHDLLLFSAKDWINGRNDLLLLDPGLVLVAAVQRDHEWCADRMEAIVAFMQSTLGVEALRDAHEQVVRIVLRRWCTIGGGDEWDGGDGGDGGHYSRFLTVLAESDGIRGELLLRAACRLCLELLQGVVSEVLGEGNGHDVELLEDVIELCVMCISRLDASSIVGEAVLRDVAAAVSEISHKCDVVAGMLPDLALSGKRLECQFVAALQRLE